MTRKRTPVDPVPKAAETARPRESSDPAVDLASFAREHGPASRRFPTDAPTIAPPSSDGTSSALPDRGRNQDVEIEITGEMPLDMREELRHEPSQRLREPMPTLTDEAELEAARARSAISSIPPRGTASDPLLSLANERKPSLTPPEPTTRRPPAGSIDIEVDFSEVNEVPTAPPPPEVQDVIAKERGPEPSVEMRERLALGDYTGALQIAEQILHEHPGNTEAVKCAEQCRDVLIKMYQARLGPLDRVPFIIVARNELRWLSIDHRAGFVLSHVDGISSLEMILDVSGMAPLDCLRILHELVQQRIIGFR